MNRWREALLLAILCAAAMAVWLACQWVLFVVMAWLVALFSNA